MPTESFAKDGVKQSTPRLKSGQQLSLVGQIDNQRQLKDKCRRSGFSYILLLTLTVGILYAASATISLK